jgi:hypothetical protein
MHLAKLFSVNRIGIYHALNNQSIPLCFIWDIPYYKTVKGVGGMLLLKHATLV